MNELRNQDRIRHFLRKRQFLLKAVLTSTLLVLLIISLLYPGTFWYLPIFGGLVSITGILLKSKILITSGIVFIGVIFFLSNLAIERSPFNIMLLIAFFVLFYSVIVYLNDLIRMDMICKDFKEDIGNTLHRYRKNWRKSIIKNLSFIFLLSLLAFMISWIGSFEFWILMDNIVLLGVSVFFTLCMLFLLFILFIKIPTLYKQG